MLYLIDMDDTLFNFKASVEHWFNTKLEPCNGHQDLSYLGDISSMYASFNFWADMKPMPWARKLLDWCDNYIVVSHAPSIYQAWTGKLEALRFLGVLPDRVIFTRHKEYLAAPDTFLIDDLESTCDKFVARGGRAYIWPSWINFKYNDPDPWETFMYYHKKDHNHG